MIRLRVFLLAVWWLLAMASSGAQQTAPDALVKEVTEEALTVLRQDPAIRRGSVERAEALVGEKIAPHFDFPRITALAVGPAWRDATLAQRAELTETFRTLLVRTYSKTLASYKDQSVDVTPLPAAPSDSEVMVRTSVNQPGAPPVSLDYRLKKGDDGWKVYDVLVDGASLVTSYRGSFANETARGGVEGLIRALQDKNDRGAGER